MPQVPVLELQEILAEPLRRQFQDACCLEEQEEYLPNSMQQSQWEQLQIEISQSQRYIRNIISLQTREELG